MEPGWVRPGWVGLRHHARISAGTLAEFLAGNRLSLCQPALSEALTANSSWGEMLSTCKWPIWSPRRRKRFPCLESVRSDSFPLLIQVSQDSNYRGTGNDTVKTTISCVVWFAVPIPSVGAGVNLLPLLLLCLSVSTNQQIHWAFWHRPCSSKGCLLNCSFTLLL